MPQDLPRTPLAGFRVVALEQAVAAPFCTRQLADLGADVIKVERVDGGDFARRYDSVVRRQSSYHVWLNRGKRSITLDLHASHDRAVLDSLLASADVFVHNLGPGSVERFGLAWPVLHETWPRLIDCAISGYGGDGPYRDRKAFDLLLQGESGLMSVTGTPEQTAKVGVSIADIAAAMYAVSAILAAIVTRQRTGEASFIDISMLECMAEWMTVPLYHYLYGGTQPPRTGTHHSGIAPYGPYQAVDGTWVNVAVQNERQWERFCGVVLERPQLANDPLFATNELRVRNRGRLEPLIESILSGLPPSTLRGRLDAADVPYGALNDVAGLAVHPQLAARRRWANVATLHGPVRALVPPFNVEGVAGELGPVPALGEHSDEIRRELDAASPRPTASPRRAPT